jgi:hypothetical protein
MAAIKIAFTMTELGRLSWGLLAGLQAFTPHKVATSADPNSRDLDGFGQTHRKILTAVEELDC